MSCIYKHTFPNGAIYIGKTDGEPESRWLHGWGYRRLPLMFNAIVEFGWKNIKHEILYDNLSHDEAVLLEKELLEEASQNNTIMYNVQYTMHSAQYPMHSDVHSDVHNNTSTNSSAHTDVPAQQVKCRRPYKQHILPIVEKPDWLTTCPIDVYDLQGNYITTYPSAKITSEELNVNQGNVVSCCRGWRATGKPQYQSNGYIFRYAPHKVNDLI